VLAALLPSGRAISPRAAIAAMFAGGATVLLGRLWPTATGGRDPVLVGTALNLACLVISGGVGHWRGRKR